MKPPVNVEVTPPAVTTTSFTPIVADTGVVNATEVSVTVPKVAAVPPTVIDVAPVRFVPSNTEV